MIAYTYVKGSGLLHAYNFSAATARQPYAAPWSADLREAETQGNTPVVEVQASRFGELLFIRSQNVPDFKRGIMYTQYLHPVPEEAEVASGNAAGALAAHADKLLFYAGFLTTEAFLRLDDDPRVQQKLLPEVRFVPPALPDAPPPPCDDRLLEALLAHLWKNCDARLRGETPPPFCVQVCAPEQAQETLPLGLLFLAKTVLPYLPLSVRAILSVTVGARWQLVSRYPGTACCIAQMNGTDPQAAYEVPTGRFLSNLTAAELELGHALREGQNLRYLRHMEAILGVSQPCADYALAVQLTALCRNLSMERLEADRLMTCIRLWRELDGRLERAYPALADRTLRRRLLAPAEQDAVRLWLTLNATAPEMPTLPTDVLRWMANRALTLPRDPLPGLPTSDMYARCLTLPLPTEGGAFLPAEALLADPDLPLDDANPTLLAQTLQRYLSQTPENRILPLNALRGCQRWLSRLDGATAASLRAGPMIGHLNRRSCEKCGLAEIMALSDAFGLDSRNMTPLLRARLNELLYREPIVDADVDALFQSVQTMRGKTEPEGARGADDPQTVLLGTLDSWFADAGAKQEANWKLYLRLCDRFGHWSPAAAETVMAHLQAFHTAPPLAGNWLKTLLTLLRKLPDQAAATALIRAYGGALPADAQGNPAREAEAALQEICKAFPLLRTQPADGGLWLAYQNQLLMNQFSRLTDQVSVYGLPFLRALAEGWEKQTDEVLVPWNALPARLGAERLQELVRKAYQNAPVRQSSPMDTTRDRLALLDRADWLSETLRPSIVQDAWMAVTQLWQAAEQRQTMAALEALLAENRERLGRPPTGSQAEALYPALQGYRQAGAALLALLNREPESIAQALCTLDKLRQSGFAAEVAKRLRERNVRWTQSGIGAPGAAEQRACPYCDEGIDAQPPAARGDQSQGRSEQIPDGSVTEETAWAAADATGRRALHAEKAAAKSPQGTAADEARWVVCFSEETMPAEDTEDQPEPMLQWLKRTPDPYRFWAACLLYAEDAPACVAWALALPLAEPVLATIRLNRVKPWRASGQPALRTLWYCLRLWDNAAEGKTNPMREDAASPPLTYLVEQCPRLTAAVRRARARRKYLPGLSGADGKADRAAARALLGASATDWLFDHSN